MSSKKGIKESGTFSVGFKYLEKFPVYILAHSDLILSSIDFTSLVYNNSSLFPFLSSGTSNKDLDNIPKPKSSSFFNCSSKSKSSFSVMV